MGGQKNKQPENKQTKTHSLQKEQGQAEGRKKAGSRQAKKKATGSGGRATSKKQRKTEADDGRAGARHSVTISVSVISIPLSSNIYSICSSGQ